MSLLHMYDFLTITKGDSRYPVQVKDSKSLYVKAHATHSGTINGNYRFYRPDSMQKATHTWLPFGAPKRPVIINHDEQSEVLGRVIDATYVDESYKWAGEFPTIKDSLFYKTDGKKVGLFQSVDWIVDNLVGQKGYSGLGYIELGLNITNPNAIEKVLRDEYLTVSVGFTTDSAICSICHQDWASDDRCDHSPGDMVDKKQMFLICGPKAYDEVSFVTFPADPFAAVLSKDALQDSLKRLSYLGLPINKRKVDITFSDSLFTYDITHAEETMDNLEQLITERKYDEILTAIKADTLTFDKATELKAGLAMWSPVAEDEKTRKRSLQSTLNAQIRKKNLDSKVADNDNPEILSAIASATDATEISLTDVSEEDKEYFNDAEGIYAEMEIVLDKIDPSAKLTSDQKASLKDADFCGPNKTFPVVNAAMASAAISVIEDSKLAEELKLKLINAISAKKQQLKALVAEEPNADNRATNAVISDKVKDMASKALFEPEERILGAFTQIDNAYSTATEEEKEKLSAIIGAIQEDWHADKFVPYIQKVMDGRGFAVLSTQDLNDKDETVNSLSDKVSELNELVAGQKKINNTLLDTYKKSLATQIVVFKILSGKEGFTDLDATSRAEKVEALAKRHVEYLKDTVNDILSEAKFKEDKLDNKAEELGNQVSDTAHVEESRTTTEPATTDTKHVVGIPQYLTPSERKMMRLQAAYDAVKKS